MQFDMFPGSPGTEGSITVAPVVGATKPRRRRRRSASSSTTPAKPRVSDQAVIDAYARHRSVWKAGAELGLSGQAVHRRLTYKLGYVLQKPEFTPAQIKQIRDYYESMPPETFDLAALAKLLGKTRHNVSRAARRMGLTRLARPKSAAAVAKNRGKPRWIGKPHPRGMAGKTHSETTKQAISLRSKTERVTQQTFGGPLVSEEASAQRSERQRLAMQARDPSTVHTRAKGGRRADLGGLFVRSRWEANYARYLNLLIKLGAVEKWVYEPKTFWFEGIRRGTTSYKPDFCVKYKGDDRVEYIEVKGWITPKDRVKWKRMAQYHPDIKLTVIKPKDYYALQRKWASAIPGWETGKAPRSA